MAREMQITELDHRWHCCIFCGSDFSPPRIRTKEHVVPSSLKGSYTTLDVCKLCNEGLGAKGGADHAALGDWRIIDAIRSLNLPDLHKSILDRATWQSKDLTSGIPIPRTRSRGGVVKIAPHEYAPGKLISSDSDVLRILEQQLRRQSPPSLNSNEIANHVQAVGEKFGSLKPGEEYFDSISGRVFKKHAVESNCEFTETARASHRLVAKIVYELAFVFLSDRVHLVQENLIPLRKFALDGIPLGTEAIGLPSGSSMEAFDPSKAKYHHLIAFNYLEGRYVIDVALFGIVDFRLVWTPSTATGHGPYPQNGESIKSMALLMTFEPGKPEERWLGKATSTDFQFRWAPLRSTM